MFYRVHHKDCPEFSVDNAWSMTWGGWGEMAPCPCGGHEDCPHCGGTGEVDAQPVRGYSCCETPEALVRYFEARSCDDDAPVVVFEGAELGRGEDNEPLVVPTRVIGWTTYGELLASAYRAA